MLLTVLVSVPVALKANGATTNNSNSTQLEFSDIDKNGNEDILFYNTTTGDVVAFMMNGTGTATGANFVAKHTVPTDYIPAGIVDINKDGNKDLLFMNVNTGDVLAFMMNNQKATGVFKVGQHSNVKQWKPIPNSSLLSYQNSVSSSSNGKYTSQLNSFIANNIGKSVYNPRGGGEALRGQCVSLVTQWQSFIGKGPGYFEGDYPIPAFNSLVNGNYGSIVAGNRNIEIIRNVAEVQPGDILIINTFPGAANGFSHTAIATSTFNNGKVEIFESNANNAAPNTTATMGSMNSSKFYGAVRYK
jgi:hypothetical protein